MENPDESFYKREEDRKWREKIDHEQVTLMTGYQVLAERIKRVERQVSELHRAILGNPETETDGAMARLHQQENAINLLKAIVLKDSAGTKGLVGRVESLESQERTQDSRWKFWTAIIVAIISLIGLCITNWDKMSAFLNREEGRDPVEQKIEHARHPKSRHRHYTVTIPSEDTDETTEKSVPQ